MIITIEILEGSKKKEPTVSGIQRNIDALQRAIDRPINVADSQLLIDTKSILVSIQKEILRNSVRYVDEKVFI